MNLHNMMKNMKLTALALMTFGLLFNCSEAQAASKHRAEEKLMYVTMGEEDIYLYNTPEEDCEVQSLLHAGDTVKVTEFQQDDDADPAIWYRVSDEDGRIGYVHKKDVTSRKKVLQKMIDYARSFVGNPYVYGGSSLTGGTDCSGFTMRIYEKLGVSLPHCSSEQSSCGTAVDLDEVKPGDLIFYGEGGIHHVALYIGEGQIVHAANSSKGIIESDMYYSTPVKARRMFPEQSGKN